MCVYVCVCMCVCVCVKSCTRDGSMTTAGLTAASTLEKLPRVPGIRPRFTAAILLSTRRPGTCRVRFIQRVNFPSLICLCSEPAEPWRQGGGEGARTLPAAPKLPVTSRLFRRWIANCLISLPTGFPAN